MKDNGIDFDSDRVHITLDDLEFPRPGLLLDQPTAARFRKSSLDREGRLRDNAIVVSLVPSLSCPGKFLSHSNPDAPRRAVHTVNILLHAKPGHGLFARLHGLRARNATRLPRCGQLPASH